MLVLSWEGAPTAPSTAPQAVLCAGGTQQPSSALPDVPPATHEVSLHSGDPCSPPHAHSTAQPWAAVTWSSCTLCPTAGLLCGHRKLRVTPHSLSTLCSAAPGVGWEGCGRAQSSAVGWGCPGTASHSLLWDLTTRPPPLELQLIPCNRSTASEGSSVFASRKEDPGPACFALCGCHAAQCDAPRAPPALGFYSPPRWLKPGQPHTASRAPLPSPAALTPHPGSAALWQPWDQAYSHRAGGCQGRDPARSPAPQTAQQEQLSALLAQPWANTSKQAVLLGCHKPAEQHWAMGSPHPTSAAPCSPSQAPGLRVGSASSLATNPSRWCPTCSLSSHSN